MKPLFGLLVLLLTGGIADAASSLRVVDGDTLELNGVVYRLHGIDAPEAGQKCNKRDGKSWACGKVAISVLEELVVGQDVRCDDRGQDDYGRTIGVCTVGTRDINARMVATGNAWAFRKYSADYADLEDKAHREHVGVWQAKTQPPWDYRAEKWAVAEQESPNGCPIKGNISENGNIYHAPWSPWYSKTKVSVDKGEHWFCSEADAVKARLAGPLLGKMS